MSERMREIKFRGITKGIGTSGRHKMIFGSLRVVTEVNRFFIISDYTDGNQREVKAETVGQFIGKKDKNDIEIYANDIVLYHCHKPHTKKEYWDPIYQIVWDGLGFGLKHIGGGKSCGDIFNLTHYPEKFEIIGNIHENPELLETSK